MKFSTLLLLVAAVSAVQLAEEPKKDAKPALVQDQDQDEGEAQAENEEEEEQEEEGEAENEDEGKPGKKGANKKDGKKKPAAKKDGKKKPAAKKDGKKKAGAKPKKAGKPGGKKSTAGKPALDYTHGQLPSGELAKGYASPEQVHQLDPKKAKFATTFYAEKK